MGGTRAGEGLLKNFSTIWLGCLRHAIADHKDCRPLGNPQKRLLEIRPPLGTHGEAELSAVAKVEQRLLDLIVAHSVAEGSASRVMAHPTMPDWQRSVSAQVLAEAASRRRPPPSESGYCRPCQLADAVKL